jgi:ABC-2 type transport system ATP-binding protein
MSHQPQESSTSNDVVLRASDLVKRFGDFTAVDHLSFEVHRGEILGFLGPNGAGKTTTLKMLCGLHRPDGGRIEIAGQALTPGKTKVLASIGVSPQHIVVWEALTCMEQLEFLGQMYGMTRHAARKRGGELLASFGLGEKANRLARTLSGGMQRRLNIALALIHEPKLLFLDEPQAGLDPQSRVMVRDYIHSLARKTTVVITTHDMEEAEKISDRVCIIDHGKLLVFDTVDRIKGQIGEDDVYEIGIDEDVATHLVAHVPALQAEKGSYTVMDKELFLNTGSGAALLPTVLEAIREHGLHLEHMRLRKRTLEDVFIHLTGRGLRE